MWPRFTPYTNAHTHTHTHIPEFVSLWRHGFVLVYKHTRVWSNVFKMLPFQHESPSWAEISTECPLHKILQFATDFHTLKFPPSWTISKYQFREILVETYTPLEIPCGDLFNPLSQVSTRHHISVHTHTHTHTHTCVNTFNRGPPIVPLLFILKLFPATPIEFVQGLQLWTLANRGPYCPLLW